MEGRRRHVWIGYYSGAGFASDYPRWLTIKKVAGPHSVTLQQVAAIFSEIKSALFVSWLAMIAGSQFTVLPLIFSGDSTGLFPLLGRELRPKSTRLPDFQEA